ncbi:hypothetical protein Q5P01_001179 [Channa striata]|uniref:Uncharacterized protein n=1 Tax=Channa striata TaxID=64152 RepID=A0AA88T2J5_CHASR|nr:hypothetical protein Q5P01_001179 [Channa striata]
MAFHLEEDLACPICHEIFKDPVVLSCSHSFCRYCVKTWWSRKQTCECPVCKRLPRTTHPPCNLVLKNLCDGFLRKRKQNVSAGSEDFCILHLEKFKLFCLDDQQPVCVVCRDSKTHLNHRFRPVAEIAQEQKEEMLNFLIPIKGKLKIIEQIKGKCDQTAQHIKIQAQHTERLIKEQFKKLYKIIQDDEEARITALREEEKQKNMKMKRKIEALNNDISTLSDTIRATEDKLRAEDVSFLQNYKAAVERVQQFPLMEDPQLVSGALIDVAKHLGNLTYPVLNKMKEMVSYTPVTLDPNTAHPHLILSDNLTSVRYGRRQKVPDNPERINYYRCILGSEGFSTGSHSWDVEVRNIDYWLLGVAAESAHRAGDIKSGLWSLKFWDGEYSVFFPPNKVVILPMKNKLERVRVHLDCNKGKLSFFDPDTKTHVHTITHTFTEKLFPYFSNGKRVPLKILPVPVSPQTPLVTIVKFIVILTVLLLLGISIVYKQ